MFGRAGSIAQRQARQSEDRSILDSVVGRCRSAANRAGRARPQSPERVSRPDSRNRAAASRAFRRTATRPKLAIDTPQGIPESFEEHAALDVRAPGGGVPGGHHPRGDVHAVARGQPAHLSTDRGGPAASYDLASRNDPQKKAMNARINLYHMQQFAKFVEKLRTTPDGDGSLLDHSLIFYGAGMGDGNAHATDPLPLVAVGGLAGRGATSSSAAPENSRGQSVDRRGGQVRRQRGSSRKQQWRGQHLGSRRFFSPPRRSSQTIRTARRLCITRPAPGISPRSNPCCAPDAKADAENRYGVTPLTLAVEAGNVDVVNALIAAGANVNHALPEGETILMTAARTGNVRSPSRTAEARRARRNPRRILWRDRADLGHGGRSR